MSTIERERISQVNGLKPPSWKKLNDIVNQMWLEDKDAFRKFTELANLKGGVVVLSTARIARVYSETQVGQESDVVIKRSLEVVQHVLSWQSKRADGNNGER